MEREPRGAERGFVLGMWPKGGVLQICASRSCGVGGSRVGVQHAPFAVRVPRNRDGVTRVQNETAKTLAAEDDDLWHMLRKQLSARTDLTPAQLMEVLRFTHGAEDSPKIASIAGEVKTKAALVGSQGAPIVRRTQQESIPSCRSALLRGLTSYLVGAHS